jgi:hypothetical protein
MTRLGSSPMPAARRFPPPWTLEEYNDACFIVRDKNGQAKIRLALVGAIARRFWYFLHQRRNPNLLMGWALCDIFQARPKKNLRQGSELKIPPR